MTFTTEQIKDFKRKYFITVNHELYQVQRAMEFLVVAATKKNYVVTSGDYIEKDCDRETNIKKGGTALKILEKAGLADFLKEHTNKFKKYELTALGIEVAKGLNNLDDSDGSLVKSDKVETSLKETPATYTTSGISLVDSAIKFVAENGEELSVRELRGIAEKSEILLNKCKGFILYA